jgi:hypothetical protein
MLTLLRSTNNPQHDGVAVFLSPSRKLCNVQHISATLLWSTNKPTMMMLRFSSVLPENTLQCALYFCHFNYHFHFIRRCLITAIDIALLHENTINGHFQHSLPVPYCACLRAWSIYIENICPFPFFSDLALWHIVV